MATVYSDFKSPWCALFTPKEVELLEYFDDMGHWWDLSYGSEINEVIGCALMTDVVEAVREVGVVGKRYKKGIFRFGHAETNVFLMSLMGLYKDDKSLTANMTHEHVQNRKFRLSDITPFASNIIYEVVSCDSGALSGRPALKVRVVINEKDVVRLPGCSDAWCPWEEFMESVGKHVGCDWDEVCGLDEMVMNKDERRLWVQGDGEW
ncbi:PHOsphatase [Rhizophlyctis rosea]|uniref:Multiple inositol polyphosphate phosphatase 1 n=1 Tax=Rhizophlyctis rosea TaxID=64517 RepID=A0AAD5S4I1_9FUNG|nr:PHOsphatase [Rhizophlyctis rosea]